jgi:divalent metal cation (Fe/Co/Zn/Cd) transporter
MRAQSEDRRVCLLALAVYVGYQSISDMVSRKASEHGLPGILLACVSLIAMALLSRAKKKVAKELGSAAMTKQTDFCAYLSAILLIGLLLNAGPGWRWPDPTATLMVVPYCE